MAQYRDRNNINTNAPTSSHARRRPESIKHSADISRTSRNSPSGENPREAYGYSAAGNGGSASKTARGAKNGVYSGEYSFRAGSGKRKNGTSSTQPASNHSAARRVTDLTPREQTKIVRREEKALREARKEERWQNEVVRMRGGIDIFLLVVILILLAFGTVTVFSASYPLAASENRPSNYYIIKQLQFVALGALVMALEIIFVPVEFYRSKFVVWGFYALALGLLVFTLFKGNAKGEAVRWVTIAGVNVQPSELMKVALIFAVSWYAGKYEKEMKTFGLGFKSYMYNTGYPVIILVGACALVLLGKHLSGTIIIGAIGGFMLIVAGCKMKWLLATGLPVAGAAIGLFLAKNPYALKRITTFTNENADKLSDLYQTTQSLYAIGSGGLFGVGVGQSRQKYGFLTQAHTDFIFSVWCEEWGFVGAVMLIGLFLMLIWRGYVIAMRAPDRYTMLTAFGITTHVGLQAFLNMCVASDLIMNTGITLPFFSYGGSSLVVLMMEMGILLSISRQYYRKKSDIEREQMMKQLGMD